MNGIEDGHLPLSTEVTLKVKLARRNDKWRVSPGRSYHKHVDRSLLSLVLEVVDIRSRHALRRIRQDARKRALAAPGEARVERTSPGVYARERVAILGP